MNWLWNYIRGRIDASRNIQVIAKDPTAVRWNEAGMTLRITPAVGGRIVAVNLYNRQQDRHTEQTYVVADGEDFDKALCHIISVESLKA
jgi:hypothetical protein